MGKDFGVLRTDNFVCLMISYIKIVLRTSTLVHLVRSTSCTFIHSYVLVHKINGIRSGAELSISSAGSVGRVGRALN